MSFEHRTEYPMPVTLDDGTVIAIEAPVTLIVERDGLVGDDWYISAVYLEGRRVFGTAMAKSAEHRLPVKDALRQRIVTWAYKHCVKGIAAQWHDWLCDNPLPRSATRNEHRLTTGDVL